MEKTKKITKEMGMQDILSAFPETFEVFMQHGLHCIGCHAAQFETLKAGALAHGIDADKLVKDLNAAVKKKRGF